MERLKEIFWDTLKLFRDLELLEHLLLVGSWAEYVYEVGYFRDYYSNLKTQDLDFLVKNINRPAKPINVVEALEKSGYTMATDYLTGVTKFYKEGILELEFLVMEKGRGQTEPYLVKPLGIKAEGLRHMDLLLENSMFVDISEHGLTVQVPTPQAYVLHKMVISHQ